MAPVAAEGDKVRIESVVNPDYQLIHLIAPFWNRIGIYKRWIQIYKSFMNVESFGDKKYKKLFTRHK